MKRFIRLYCPLFVLLFCTCEERVDLSLPPVDPVLVIDAIVANIPDESRILLSTTAPYNQPGTTPKVTDAIVIVSDKQGRDFTFFHQGTGRYTAPKATFQQGVEYDLKVIYNKQTYTASSIMPYQVNLDSGRLGDNNLSTNLSFSYVNADFKDPLGVKNYYMWETFVNGNRVNTKDIVVHDDSGVDGKKLSYTVLIPFPDKNHIVTTKLLSINRESFDYYSSLKKLVEQDASSQSSPQNPKTNISGGVLGFFAAVAVSTIDISSEE